MNPLLQLFLGVFGGLDPQDLITGPDPSLGTPVWVHDASGNIIELTDPANQNPLGPLVGAGFGNPANKYSWSSAVYNGDLYIGTFNSFFDYKGGIAAYLRITQQAKVGAGLSNPANLFQILTDNSLFPTLLDSQGGEIWKYDSGTNDVGAAGGTWSKVYDATLVPQLGPDVAGFRSMVSYDGKLLAASSSSLIFDLLSINQDQPTTISMYNGTSWSVLTGGPFDDPDNSSIRTMKEVDGKLIIGTENAREGAQLWSLEFNGDTPVWAQISSPTITYTANTGNGSLNAALVAATSGLYNSATFAASTGDIVDLDQIYSNDNSLTQFENNFLVGTWQPFGLFLGDTLNSAAPLIQILSPANLLAWGEGSFNTDLSPIPQGGTDNGVMRMEVYNGYLYVGSVNYTGGTSLTRIALSQLNTRLANPPFDSGLGTNGGWQILTTDGFRSLSSDLDPGAGVISLVQLDGDGNIVANAVTNQVKGDSGSGNGGSVYSWSMKVVNGKLYVGDFSGAAGVARLYEIEDQTTSVNIKLVSDAFGAEAYGLRTMQVYGSSPNQSLIIGDADPFDSEIGLLNRFIDDPTRLVRLITRSGSGGENDDVLFGATASVKISGLDGEDIIVGGQYDDELDGGKDQDLMIGSLGRDKMRGGEQSDLMWGDLVSFGSESLAAGLEIQLQALLLQAVSPEMVREITTSNPSVESLLSALQEIATQDPAVNEALSELSTLIPTEIVWGEEALPSLQVLGNSNIALSSFNDLMYGDDGEDIMFGGLGADRMFGGADSDILTGQEGNDSLSGGKGNDQLEGGRGRDKYYGGIGNDIYDLRLQIEDSSGNPIMITDNERDGIYYSQREFEAMPVKETVFGFEQGIDKVYMSKGLSVSINGNVATLTFNGTGKLKGSTIDLTNADTNFIWSTSDFTVT